ncbi:hypothetical protein ACQP2X_11085 [Actinoplanes sp. CA-131856]
MRATSATGETTGVEVVGWRAALRRRDAMAAALREPRRVGDEERPWREG